jgi:stearoyl-CoA desaturase (delta-9 desaturase)
VGGRVNWASLIAIILVHIGALLAFMPFLFTWKALGTALALQLICGLGITIGYHRLLTHRSFRTVKPIEYFLSWLGSLSWQGGPIKWAATHRLHHQHSDEQGDPHSPNHGFFWSHALWCFTFDAQFDPYSKYSGYALDLARDPGHVFIERTTPFWPFLLALLLYVWGGWPCVIWGVFVRLVYVYHATWFVNSASHVWGYRNFNTTDQSRNLWWVALLSFGEGWHNNHHAYPRSARHGLRFWEIDLSWWVIRAMQIMGLARDIRLPEVGASRSGK